MATKRFFFTVLLSAGIYLGILPAAFAQSGGSEEQKDTMLCVGAHWTPEQGQAFLNERREHYTTSKAWKKRKQDIRRHILHNAGLGKMPEKTPLHPIFGEIRTFDGYRVQNVAFESI